MMTKNLSFGLEIKSVSGRKFEGYGSVFGNRDLGGDIVVPGAFSASLKAHKAAGTMPLMFWMHDPSQVPGVWEDMQEDDSGLYVKGEIVDTALGRDVKELLSKKAVRGLSIGYVPDRVDFDRDGNRLLKQVELHEVSVVSMAMNPLARVVGMKARLSYHGEYVPQPSELERILRNNGFSKSVSRAIVSRIYDDTEDGDALSPRRHAGDVDGEAKELGDVLALARDLQAGLTLSAAVARLR